MLLKKRLLQQFALPTDHGNAYGVEWIRPRDLFGDHFSLTAQVKEASIHFDYRHRPVGSPEESSVWSLTIALSPTGRARVESSDGIEPKVNTVYRAAALIEQATKHLQANPAVMPPERKESRRLKL